MPTVPGIPGGKRTYCAVSRITGLTIPERNGLDTIIVYWYDCGPNQGHVTITCWGSAWTAYFGGMSAGSIQEFFKRVDALYLVNKLGIASTLKAGRKYDKYLERIILAIKAVL